MIVSLPHKRAKNPSGRNQAHIDNREGSAKTLRLHPQQVLHLGDENMHGRCCSEASHQRLCEVDRHEAKPEKTEDELEKKRKENKERGKGGKKTVYLALFQTKNLKS